MRRRTASACRCPCRGSRRSGSTARRGRRAPGAGRRGLRRHHVEGVRQSRTRVPPLHARVVQPDRDVLGRLAGGAVSTSVDRRCATGRGGSGTRSPSVLLAPITTMPSSTSLSAVSVRCISWSGSPNGCASVAVTWAPSTTSLWVSAGEQLRARSAWTSIGLRNGTRMQTSCTECGDADVAHGHAGWSARNVPSRNSCPVIPRSYRSACPGMTPPRVSVAQRSHARCAARRGRSPSRRGRSPARGKLAPPIRGGHPPARRGRSPARRGHSPARGHPPAGEVAPSEEKSLPSEEEVAPQLYRSLPNKGRSSATEGGCPPSRGRLAFMARDAAIPTDPVT